MKNIILFGCICVSLISCDSQRYIYNPSPFYNPLFAGKGESNITALASYLDNHNRGFDIQAAYAVSKHFALTATYNNRREKDNYYSYWDINGDKSVDSSVVRYQRQSWSLGAGYFLPFNKNKSSFSIYGSVAMGSNKINDIGLKENDPYTNFHNSNCLMYSIQPSINLGLTKRWVSSIITRFTLVNNRNINTDYTTDELMKSGLYGINGLFYSAIGYSAHISPFKKYPWLKLDEQILFSSTGETKNQIHYARGTNGSTGISIELDKLLKKK